MADSPYAGLFADLISDAKKRNDVVSTYEDGFTVLLYGQPVYAASFWQEVDGYRCAVVFYEQILTHITWKQYYLLRGLSIAKVKRTLFYGSVNDPGERLCALCESQMTFVKSAKVKTEGKNGYFCCPKCLQTQNKVYTTYHAAIFWHMAALSLGHDYWLPAEIKDIIMHLFCSLEPLMGKDVTLQEN